MIRSSTRRSLIRLPFGSRYENPDPALRRRMPGCSSLTKTSDASDAANSDAITRPAFPAGPRPKRVNAPVASERTRSRGKASAMAPIKRLVRRIDARQQRTPVLAFPFAVVKKFGDDRAGGLAALMAYYGFLALFPLLLLLVTLLGLALRGNESLQRRVLQSALSDFPIIGDQLRDNIHSLRLSGVGLVIGILGLVWGSLGVTQAAQHAMAQIWNVEGKDRPPFFARFARGLLFIGLLGLDIVADRGCDRARIGRFRSRALAAGRQSRRGDRS